MNTLTRTVGLLAFTLSAAGCCVGGAAPALPGAPAAAAPVAAPVAPPPPPPPVTVASCTTASAAGRLCIEFDQAQYATLGPGPASAFCTAQLGSPIRVNTPCEPTDRMGSCALTGHVLYSYWIPDASEDAYRRLCETSSGRFLAGGHMAEPGPDAVHPDANTPLTIGQVVLSLCVEDCIATSIGRVVDLLPDGRVTVESQGERSTMARDRIWVGSFTPVPNGMGNRDVEGFPTITDAPLPAGTEVWAKDTWWYRGRVVEDTGGARLSIDFYAYVGEPQQITRRNVRLHR